MAFDELDRVNEPPERKINAPGSWDNLSNKERKERFARRERLGLVGAQDDGFFGELSDQFQGSVISGLKGIGSTANELGLGSGMQDYFQGVLNRNQQWNTPEERSVAGYIGGAIGNATGSTAVIAPAIAADALFGTKGVATFSLVFAQSFGDNVKRNRAAYGPENEEKSIGLAAAESAVDSFIEVGLGTIPMLGKWLKGLSYSGKRELVKGMFREAEKQLGRTGAQRFFVGMGMNSVGEMSEEGWQCINTWIWRAIGGDKENEFSLKELANNMAQGAIGGAALGVVGGGQETQLYGKKRPWLKQKTSAATSASPSPAIVTMPDGVSMETPAGPAVPINPDASEGRSMMEAYYEEAGIPLARMTPEEQQTEGIGRVTAADGIADETNGMRDDNGVKINPSNEGEIFSHGHELFHEINATAPDLAEQLSSVMDEELNAAGLAEQGERDRNELHADMLGKIMQDPDAMLRTVEEGERLHVGFGEKFLHAVIQYAQKMMAYAKAHANLKGAEQYFNNYKRVRDSAANVLAEFRRRTGTSTEAENVVGVQGENTVTSVPVSELNIDPARFQFKSKADKVTGVDESNQIGGKWDPKTAGNLYVWEDKTGKKIVVNGHHRFQLAKENNVGNVNAIIDREADGVTAEQARRNGVLINIREEQGDVQDYADFVRNEKMDETTAKNEGVLDRGKGQTGYTIGKYASDNLYSIFKAGDIPAGGVAVIADVARGDEALEAAGIRAAKNGMPAKQIRDFLNILKNTPRQQTEQGDLFGFDDSAIKTAETLSKLAAKHIKEVKEKVNAAKAAIKNPDAAKKLGVNVGKSAEKLLAKAQNEAAKWEHWYTDPELSSLLKKEAGLENNGLETDSNGLETDNAEKSVVKKNLTTEPETAQKSEKIEHPDDGRFNIDSDTPLLTPEEDANDFQLVSETREEEKKRDASAEREEKARHERAQEEAKKASPDLFPNDERGEKKDVTGVDVSKKENTTAAEQKQTAHPVPVNYKKFDGDYWELSKTLGELLPEFMAALDDGHKLYTDTAKGIYHLEKTADGKYKQTLPNGEERLISRGTMKMFIDRALVSDNPKIELKEELPIEENRLYSVKKRNKTDEKRAYYDVPFEESVDSVISGSNKAEGLIFVRETPDVLKKIGIPGLPVMMTKQHIRDIYNVSAPAGRNAHGLGEQLKHLPEMLEKPIAVIASKENGRVVVITQYQDKNGKDIIVPVIIGTDTSADGGIRITANIAASTFGKKDAVELLKDAVAKENNGEIAIFGANKKFASKLPMAGTPIVPTGGFNAIHNIDDDGSPVKGFFKKQTETLQFKKWFEDSQVVDKDGNPLVVYHGSDYDPLSMPDGKGTLNPHTMFTANPDYAARYGKNVGAYYLAIKHPFDIRNAEDRKIFTEYRNGHEPSPTTSGAMDWADYDYDDFAGFLNEKFPGKYDGAILDEGGDGGYGAEVKTRGISYVIFNENQAKSATDNIGTFDKNNPDVRYSLKKRRQVNPIVQDGKVRKEYQDLLDNKEYTPERIADWDKKAIEWIDRQGGIAPSVESILHDTEHTDRHVATIIRRHVMNSDVFRDLPKETRDLIEVKNVFSGTEWGREGVARRLASLTLDSVTKVQAVFDKLNEKLSDADRIKLRNDILKRFDIDIADLPDDIADNKSRLDAILRAAAAHQAKLGDKLYEFWINAILSGPSTHFVNTAGNTANALYEMGIKRFVEASLNVIAQKKDAATFGEFKEMLHVIDWRGAKERFLNALDQEMLNSSGKLDSDGIAIGGKLGRVIRTPGRLLRAADEFAKAIIAPMEAAAKAYRDGKAKGLLGEKLSSYIQSEIKNERSEASRYGRDKAVEYAFQKNPGTAVQYLIGLKNKGGVSGTILKFFLPFLTAPTNIMKQAVRKSPFGSVSLAIDTAKIALGKGEVNSEYLGRVAEQIIAWGTLMTLMGMGDDDDEPVITGTSPDYGSAEQKWKANKIPPYSIRIGDTWCSYRRIEPLAGSLAFIADGIQAIRGQQNGENATQLLKRMTRTTKQLIGEKSFLDGIGQLIKLYDDPERSVANWGTTFLASWMPNAYRQVNEAIHGDVQDTKSRAKGIDFLKDQFKITTDKMGITRANPKLDYFGRDVKKDSADGPLGFLARMASINPVENDNMTRADTLMWNYNRMNPDAEYYPDLPAYYFTRDGKKLYMAGEDYSDFAREAGQLAEKQINNAFRHGLLHENNPTKRDIDLIKKIFSRARKETREKFFRQHRYSE